MKYFSMFSGIGGFELGIQQAYESMDNRGITSTSTLEERWTESDTNSSDGDGERPSATCVGYSEIDKYAIQIYDRHFKHKNYGNATTINAAELPDFDLLVGGFPCQAFSIAGKRGGLDDARGTLFYDIARIAKEKRPKHLLLENVKGLLSHDNGRTFKLIISTFALLGYNLEWQVLNSKNFGVPQNRERVFIIGHLGACCGRQVFPLGGSDAEIAESGEKPNRQILRQFRDFTDSTNNDGGTESANGFRIRRLTPTECERLQAYPDGWTKYGTNTLNEITKNVYPPDLQFEISDTQRYKTLGNSVTVSVIQYLIQKLYET